MSAIPITLNSEVTSLLKCGICWEYYNLPTVLPCGHTFCLTCIQEIGKHKVNNLQNTKLVLDLSINCPNCRLKVTISDIQRMKNGVHVNYVLSSIVEAVIQLKSTQKVDAGTNTDSDACFKTRINEIQKSLEGVYKAVDKRKSVVNDARKQIDELRTKTIRRKMIAENLKRQKEEKSSATLPNRPTLYTQGTNPVSHNPHDPMPYTQGMNTASQVGLNPMPILYQPTTVHQSITNVVNNQQTWASRLFLPERIQNSDQTNRNVHDLSDVDPAILSVRTTTSDMIINGQFYPLAML